MLQDYKAFDGLGLVGLIRRGEVSASEVLEAAELPGREDVGALRLRLVATKNRPCADHPLKTGEGYDPDVILDLDYWALLPR